jgi:hypothetical protein
MNTIDIFKTLQGAFALPARQKKESIQVNEWAFEGSSIRMELFIDGMHDDYIYTCKADIEDFRKYCGVTCEVPSLGYFCEWFKGLLGEEQTHEVECFAELNLRLIPVIKADYATWLANRD